MNKKPVSYLQTYPRWKSLPYRVKGESSTIGSAGCGPTCAAMLIETLTGKTFTPVDACSWSVAHGYKALNQGTYYGYFEPQFKEFGLSCKMLNFVNTYGKPNHDNHKKAFELLKQGFYLIACMGPGTWTKSGHFVVVWWEDGKVRINDPASTKDIRLNGDLSTFKSQVKYYWYIDAVKHNKGDDELTQEQFNEMFRSAMAVYNADKAKENPESWSQKEREWAEKASIVTGYEDGFHYHSPVTREEMAVMLYRLSKEIRDK